MQHRLLLVTIVLAAACGKSKSTGTGGAAASGGSAASASGASGASGASDLAADTGPKNTCELHIRGDATLDVTASAPRANLAASGGKVSAGTDYWMSEDEQRSALKTLAGLMTKKSDDAVAAEVEADMKKEPRIMLLLVNCSADEAHVNLMPGGASKYADVPFAPKKYALVPTQGAKAGEFVTMFGFTPPSGERTSYSVSEPGTFDLTKFDKTGIAGTFHFVAKSFKGDKSVTVDGKFDYGCLGETVCAK